VGEKTTLAQSIVEDNKRMETLKETLLFFARTRIRTKISYGILLWRQPSLLDDS